MGWSRICAENITSLMKEKRERFLVSVFVAYKYVLNYIFQY